MIDHSVFSVVAGLIVKILFMLFSVYNAALRAKMSEYEAHWLTGFLLINIWACINQEVIYLFKTLQCTQLCRNIQTKDI